MGTIIYDQDTDEIIADIILDDQKVLILPGGKGGKGNSHFATSTNRTPRFAQPGTPGRKKRLRLSLKYLADIGIIGLPNAGKSTLLSRLTMARPKIDGYPFTTTVPNLGVIEFDDRETLTLADIPGLIEGASEGRGLGHRFLKHIERTKFLLHLLDLSYVPDVDLLEDFHLLRDELEKYNPALPLKNQMVLINKIDLPLSSKTRDVKEITDALDKLGIKSLPVSALTGEGLEKLKEILAEKLLANS